MTPERWQKACEIFAEAVQHGEAERGAFLARVCRGDNELRRDVEGLLASDAQAEPVFQQLPAAVASAVSEALPAAAQDADAALIGTRIGQYQITGVIGAGGMSTVFEAVQERPKRTVALKVMKPGVVSKPMLRRFESEADTLARLRHPNIAQIYEAGWCENPSGWCENPFSHPPPRESLPASVSERSGAMAPEYAAGEGAQSEIDNRKSEIHGRPWFAMEFIPGARPITEYARMAALTTRDRLRLFVKVCHAVAHGHEKGIIHRDLKPTNIVVEGSGLGVSATADLRQGSVAVVSDRDEAPSTRHSGLRTQDSALRLAEPKVIDFGIARATDADVPLATQNTLPGQLIGTLQYMSPEQCEDPHDVDTRSDVYALGIVLYELLADRLPYDVSDTTIYKAIKLVVEQVPTPLPQLDALPNPLRKEFRGDIDAIVRKALSKDRTHRYRSAAELAADIERHLRGEPTEARPPTTWERATRWVACHPRATTGVISLTVALLVLPALAVGVAYWLNRSSPFITLREGRSYAELTGRFGYPLAPPWRTDDARRGFIIADLVQSSLPGTPRDLILLNFGRADDVPYAGRVCAFDADYPNAAPIVFAPVEQSDLPEEYREELPERTADEFELHQAVIADVFGDADLPGKEVVAVFASAWSARLIRVYDFSGRVWYQAWLDGGTTYPYWMKDAKPKLLVFGLLYSGLNYEDGKATARRDREPLFVLALEPVRGHRGTRFMPCEPGAGPDRVRWCRQIPNAMLKHANVHTVSAPGSGPGDPGHSVEYNVNFKIPGEPSASWIIGESGETLNGPHFNNSYMQLERDGLPELPKREELRLHACDCTVEPEAPRAPAPAP